MPGNIITITFNEDLLTTGTLSLSGSTTSGVTTTPFDYGWTWADLRNAAFKVTTGSPTLTPGERSAINFVQAFNLDVNGTNLYSVVRNLNVVTITAQSTSFAGITFTNGIAVKTMSPPTSADVDFTYGSVNTANFNIVSIGFTPFVYGGCSTVNVTVIANQIVTSVTSPVALTPNDETFVFEYQRGGSGIITMQNGAGAIVNQSFQAPILLSIDNYNLIVNSSPNGGTVVISPILYDSSLTVEYGIGDAASSAPTAWQSTTVFSGIAPGNYKIYVRDQFGCVKTKPFQVYEYQNNRSPFFFVSKSMSFRFANRVTWGNSSNYKNDENTLSCEVDVKLPYKEIQQFQSSDFITTQIKSSYATNTAVVVKSDGTEISIPVIKKSNNIGIKDRRDAIVFNLGGGKNGMYFTSGNTYDYDLNTPNGTYALNGSLPVWAVVGAFILFDSGWFRIDQITFDEAKNADVIVFNGGYTGVETLTRVSSIYNLFDYEIYEFALDLSTYLNQKIRVRINAVDADFGNLALLSEVIEVKTRQEGTVEIKYSNPENTDVFYSTGITNLIRLPLTSKNGVLDVTNEAYKTDTTAFLLGSEVYEVDQFIFEPVTKEIMRKLIQALNHKNVQLDGVPYIINGQPEMNGPLGQSNLYVITATMIKTGGAFNSSTGSEIGIIDGENTEIQGLIDIGDGSFLEHK